MKNLLKEYRKKKKEIGERLRFFRGIYSKSETEVFEELCFCLLTPQAKAVECDRAVKNLKKHNLISRGCAAKIRPYLSGVRFPNNKARYLVEARAIFKNGKGFKIKEKINTVDCIKTREWLVKNVKGMGFKEATHFLRNIGLGGNMAILDRHILKNLKKYGVIKEIPKTLTKKEYLKIEEKMRDFFGKSGISMEEVDLLFWSRETGFIFK